MLAIRLSRIGKKNSPIYRLVISEKGRDPFGRSLEILGQYNPKIDAKILNLKEDRVKYWLSKGAQMSATVNNLLVGQGILTCAKVKKVKVKKADKKDEDKKGVAK